MLTTHLKPTVSNDSLKLATVEWLKEPFESWRARAENQVIKVTVATRTTYTLPTLVDAAGGCIEDGWMATAGPPLGRVGHTAVWTGSEMIIWGGFSVEAFNTGGRYNPATDDWTSTTITNAPDVRFFRKAVWTGSETGIVLRLAII